MNVYGLLLTKGEAPLVAEWCREQAALYDAIVCLDGTADGSVADVLAGYPHVIRLAERDCEIPHKTDHGLRRIAHQEIIRRFGRDGWVMCCHPDEFCYHDPRKIVDLAQRQDSDGVAWYSPHFYPHPSERSDIACRLQQPLEQRFQHYHWNFEGSGRPWVEFRLYRLGEGVEWDAATHGSTEPHGLSRIAPFQPILRHYKVTDLDLSRFEVIGDSSYYRDRWQGLADRTGVAFQVRQRDDLFVERVPHYHSCDRYVGRFAQPWNMGDEYRPEADWPLRRREAGSLACRDDFRTAQPLLAALIQASAVPWAQAAVMSDLAAVAAARGRFAAAERGFRRALRLDPDQRAARQNLSRLSSQIPCPASAGAVFARPRIAILSLLFNWPSTAGGTVHTKELADALQGDGYDVRHIYAVYDPWGLGRVTEALSVPTTPLVFDQADWTADNIRDKFREAVDEFAPEAVIITDSWNTKPLLAEAVADFPYFLRLAALETVCPLNNVRLLCERGALVQCGRNQLAEPYACRACVTRQAASSGGLHQAERTLAGFFDDDYPGRLRRAYQGAAAVLVVNPTIAELVRPFCRRVEVIPSGFDPARFPAPDCVRDVSAASPRTRFLFAGLVDEPMKGFAVLFEACQRLWSARHDFELVVTSDLRAEWDAPFVRWIGWQSQQALPVAIRAADVLVFPTVAQEALGRTAVEAMGCATPVIASRLGGLPWVVEDEGTGLLATPGDPADLVRKMSRLIDDPTLRLRLGRAGREKFEREFSWPVILERHYRPLFKQLVAQPGTVG